MKVEILEEANKILRNIKLCENIHSHIFRKNRLTLRFDTTRECIESHEDYSCPKWLLDIIEEGIEKHKEELKEEFDNL